MTVRRQIAILAVGLGLCVATAASAQQGASDIGSRLMQVPAVAAATQAADRLEPWVVEQQIALCEVEAPPFREEARGKVYRDAFTKLGLSRVRVDAVGNVIGERPGSANGPHVVISAHLDTVFPPGTPVHVSRKGNVLLGPGISDDCRGLAVVLGVIRALQDAKVSTPGRITFVGTVGEEGLGDLRGVKHLFGPDGLRGIDRFVSIDGSGFGVTNGGVGSKRYRVTFKGPGGHSYGAFGMPNPLHALGRAVAAIAALEVPTSPKTTFNVGRVGGGTSVNSIPFEAWIEIDLRSEQPEPLAGLDAHVRKAIEGAVAAENARWRHTATVTADVELVGDRPAGRTPDTSDIVQAAMSVLRTVGRPASLHTSSTDSNVAMARGVPAITIGGGGIGSGSHSLQESFDVTGGGDGLRQAILLTIALAQP
ncbi:MAG: M20/M25/M40 family metallo-hydrolase [Acidobacteria bacterium]|nr:M20/M25/M40 family metallo-hydrolase [Acidobacteriota bacterium]